MADGDYKYYRPRLNVPLADTSVVEWMRAQDSLSLSLRQLIKESVEQDGIRDIFTDGPYVKRPRRGRPRKKELETVQTVEQVPETPVATPSVPQVAQPIAAPVPSTSEAPGIALDLKSMLNQ